MSVAKGRLVLGIISSKGESPTVALEALGIDCVLSPGIDRSLVSNLSRAELTGFIQTRTPHVDAGLLGAIWILNHRPKVDAVFQRDNDYSFVLTRGKVLSRRNEHVWEAFIAEGRVPAGTSLTTVDLSWEDLSCYGPVAPQNRWIEKATRGLDRIRRSSGQYWYRANALLWPGKGKRARQTVAILFIVPWMEVGGADKVNLDLLRALPSTYRKIVLTTVRSTHPLHRQFIAAADEVYDLTRITRNDREATDFLGYLIETQNIQLIQISNSLSGYKILALLRRTHHVPTVSLVHMSIPEDPWDYVRVSWKNQDAFDMSVAVSHALRAEMIRMGFPEGGVHTIYNGVDTAKYYPDASVRSALRERVVLFVGRLVEQKNPRAFVQMARILAHDNTLSDVIFVMVGDGPLRKSVEEEVAACSLGGRIHLVGSLDEEGVRHWLQSAFVLVMPSIREGLPIVGIEAFACGVPVVATEVEGWSEVIDNGVNGMLVPPGDPAELARAVERCISDDEWHKRLSAAARQKALDVFMLDKMATSYEQLYENLLSGGAEA